MILRVRTPDGGNHDVVLGPSGHVSRHHHFDTLWHTETPPARIRQLAPRCLAEVGAKGCQRPVGHNGKHQAYMHGMRP